VSERVCEVREREGSNRVFYLAIPPTLFVSVGKGIQPAAMSKTGPKKKKGGGGKRGERESCVQGWNRVIVEKPFGKDSESSRGSYFDHHFFNLSLHLPDCLRFGNPC